MFVYSEQNFARAAELYTLAIENNPNDPAYYGNRSFAYIKSEFYGKNLVPWLDYHVVKLVISLVPFKGSALSDANKAIQLDPKYIKGYYRRASSYLALGKFKLALKDYEFVKTKKRVKFILLRLLKYL